MIKNTSAKMSQNMKKKKWTMHLICMNHQEVKYTGRIAICHRTKIHGWMVGSQSSAPRELVEVYTHV